MVKVKRLVTQREREQQRKKNQWTVGIVLVVLMVLSTLGFAFQGNLYNDPENGAGNENNLTYNGFEFEFVNGFWLMGSFVFSYAPTEIPDLKIDSVLNVKGLDNYREKPLYIYSESPQAESEIKVNLGQIASDVKNACPTEETDCEYETKTCNDNFIIIKKSDNKVEQKENCVFIYGESQRDMLMSTDQFLYKILGIK